MYIELKIFKAENQLKTNVSVGDQWQLFYNIVKGILFRKKIMQVAKFGKKQLI